jgi:hypothetical protein
MLSPELCRTQIIFVVRLEHKTEQDIDHTYSHCSSRLGQVHCILIYLNEHAFNG